MPSGLAKNRDDWRSFIEAARELASIWSRFAPSFDDKSVESAAKVGQSAQQVVRTFVRLRNAIGADSRYSLTLPLSRHVEELVGAIAVLTSDGPFEVFFRESKQHFDLSFRSSAPSEENLETDRNGFAKLPPFWESPWVRDCLRRGLDVEHKTWALKEECYRLEDALIEPSKVQERICRMLEKATPEGLRRQEMIDHPDLSVSDSALSREVSSGEPTEFMRRKGIVWNDGRYRLAADTRVENSE